MVLFRLSHTITESDIARYVTFCESDTGTCGEPTEKTNVFPLPPLQGGADPLGSAVGRKRLPHKIKIKRVINLNTLFIFCKPTRLLNRIPSSAYLSVYQYQQTNLSRKLLSMYACTSNLRFNRWLFCLAFLSLSSVPPIKILFCPPALCLASCLVCFSTSATQSK